MIGTLTMESIESKLAGPVSPVVGNTFVINGAPFNGSGAGYRLSHRQQLQPYGAILSAESHQSLGRGGRRADCAHAALRQLQLVQPRGRICPRIPPTTPLDYGGMDESYDAPDLQNLFLAMVPPRTAEQLARGTGRRPIIPSFHRPELVTYSLANSPSDTRQAIATGLFE